MTEAQISRLRIFISIAEAAHKGSPCWHILDWLSWKSRLEFPLARKDHWILNWDISS